MCRGASAASDSTQLSASVTARSISAAVASTYAGSRAAPVEGAVAWNVTVPRAESSPQSRGFREALSLNLFHGVGKHPNAVN